MSARIRRYAISLVCALLCWALVVTPCLYIAKGSFASSGNPSAAFNCSTLAAIPSDRVSFPPVISQSNAGGSDSQSIQDLAASDKVLSGLGGSSGDNKVPSKYETPSVQKPSTPTKPEPQTPQGGVTAPSIEQEKDITYALLTQPSGKSFIYYEQTWEAYKNYPYGYNTVGGYGCGPTSMAMVISNLTGITVSPKYMADWSVNNGYYVRGSGTAYGIFPAASAAYGIKCSTISCYDKEAVVSALKSGKLLITVVSYGDFTRGRHFLLIRGITEDGKLLLADSGKYENCLVEWDYARVISQVANSTFWVFEK